MSDRQIIVTVVNRNFDINKGGVYWWCSQNMVWDEGPSPRDCTPEKPHPDIGSGVCGWALVVPEVIPDE